MTGLESDAHSQESEPTPQALSDGILVVGISSKRQRRDFRRTNKIPQNACAHARAHVHASAHAHMLVRCTCAQAHARAILKHYGSQSPLLAVLYTVRDIWIHYGTKSPRVLHGPGPSIRTAFLP